MSSPTSDRPRGLRARLARFPWWAALPIGAALAALGLWLMVRPLSSTNLMVLAIGLALIFNGIGELLQQRTSGLSIVGAVALAATGVFVLAFRGLSTSLLAIVIAAALVVLGALRIIAGVRPGAEERATTLVLGVAAVLAGIVALAWPDVTLLVAAIAFGGWTLFFGVQLVWNAIASCRGKPTADAAPSRRGWFARSARLIGALAVLAIVVAAGVTSVRMHRGVPGLDDFYAGPTVLPSEPGVLLRAEPFTRAMPAGAQAWRILYTTTRDDGQPALASALVIAPRDPPAGPMPLIAWTHGTTGYAQVCAPSLLPNPLVAGAMSTPIRWWRAAGRWWRPTMWA